MQSSTFEKVFGHDRKFLGCFYQSDVPSLKNSFKVGCYCVVNLESPDKAGTLHGGTHWTGLYRKSSKVFWYFDPFGLLAPQGVDKFCDDLKAKVIYNLVQLQPVASRKCGLWVLTWLSSIVFHDLTYEEF